MKLFKVHVIDGTPRAKTAKVFVQEYAVLADSAQEAAQRVVRSETVFGRDQLLVTETDGLTSLGSSRMRERALRQLLADGFEEFSGEALGAQNV